MKRILANTFFPKKCASCGTILPVISNTAAGERVLCAPCRGKWEREKGARCRYCGKRMFECRCTKDLLFKCGVRTHIKLVRYRPADRECAANGIIYDLKRKNDAFVFAFAAEQLGRPFLKYVTEKNVDADDVVITYVPRLPRQVKKYGYDQAKVLASLLAGGVSLEARELIKRVGKSREQKNLTKTERVANVAGAFAAASDADLRGKTVFLVDDVVTSGASMAACAEVLRGMGADDIVALSIASTK